MHVCWTRSIKRPGFSLSAEALAKAERCIATFKTIRLRQGFGGRKEVAMKLLIVVMLVRTIIAYLENTKRKNKNEVRTDADNAMVQHPAAKLLR